ncbi:MAG: hypothetical protein HOZ81_44095 [Streptomyces sp.]|nr:hypothetical protein [Streptomyces sp.]NUS77427.1 hypothetical protein [Streptomyces sp.]
MGVAGAVGRELCLPPLSPVLDAESALGAPTALPELAVDAGSGLGFASSDDHHVSAHGSPLRQTMLLVSMLALGWDTLALQSAT